jgi:hypothetical protein
VRLAICALLCAICAAPARAAPAAHAGSSAAPPGAYELLSRKATALSSEDHANGWAYVISGGVVLGLSIPMYYLSEDVFARVVYTAGQTLGVAAVGYGSYLVLIENDYARFKGVVDRVPSLTPGQRNQLAWSFLEDNAARARSVRKIRVISHGLTAGLSFLSGSTTSNRELRTAQYFIGGINVLAALSFGLGSSEEEDLAGQAKRASLSPSLGPTAGPLGAGLALRLSF